MKWSNGRLKDLKRTYTIHRNPKDDREIMIEGDYQKSDFLGLIAGKEFGVRQVDLQSINLDEWLVVE
jgi:hypothetical protein